MMNLIINISLIVIFVLIIIYEISYRYLEKHCTLKPEVKPGDKFYLKSEYVETNPQKISKPVAVEIMKLCKDFQTEYWYVIYKNISSEDKHTEIYYEFKKYYLNLEDGQERF